MFRDVEVCDVNTLLFGDQDVAWLDVSVTDALLVHIGDSFKDLSVNKLGVSFIVTTHAGNRVQNFMALDKFHDLVHLIFEVILEDLHRSYDVSVL